VVGIKDKDKLQYQVSELFSERDLRSIASDRFLRKYYAWLLFGLVISIIAGIPTLITSSTAGAVVSGLICNAIFLVSVIWFFIARRRYDTSYVKAQKKVK
jgi:FtsH-binding integral membrane protein